MLQLKHPQGNAPDMLNGWSGKFAGPKAAEHDERRASNKPANLPV